MKLLSVNFHYIEDERNDPYPAIYPTSPKAFRTQLEHLSRYFQFISGDQLEKAVNHELPLPENSCFITLDDGIASQYETALPILDSMGIPAVFFASALPWNDGKVVNVHKIHYVRSQISPSEMLSALRAYIQFRQLNLQIDSEEITNRAIGTYRYDSKDAAKLKLILNFLLSPEHQAAFIDELFSKLVDDESAWIKKFYMSPAQLATLAQRRYLGNHGYSHRPVATLAPQLVSEDVISNQSLLEKATQQEVPKWISYPYGGLEAVTPKEAQIVANLGFTFAFTMERAINTSLREPQLLARIDTNDAPGGKSPVFSIEGGELKIKTGITLGRTRYFKELES